MYQPGGLALRLRSAKSTRTTSSTSLGDERDIRRQADSLEPTHVPSPSITMET
jgi:hypothetical protein